MLHLINVKIGTLCLEMGYSYPTIDFYLWDNRPNWHEITFELTIMLKLEIKLLVNLIDETRLVNKN